MLVTIIVILIVLALVGGPYTGFHSYGWGPSGGLSLLVVLLIVLLLMGRV